MLWATVSEGWGPTAVLVQGGAKGHLVATELWLCRSQQEEPDRGILWWTVPGVLVLVDQVGAGLWDPHTSFLGLGGAWRKLRLPSLFPVGGQAGGNGQQGAFEGSRPRPMETRWLACWLGPAFQLGQLAQPTPGCVAGEETGCRAGSRAKSCVGYEVAPEVAENS